MRYPIVLTFLMLTSSWLCAQELQLERIEKIHKALTEEYDESRFVPGYYVTETDTIRTSVYVYRRRQRALGHYAVIINDKFGLHILDASQISSYWVRGQTFESIRLKEKDCFMSSLVTGSMNLYTVARAAGSGGDAYLLGKSGTNTLLILDPSSSNIQEVRRAYSGSNGQQKEATVFTSRGNTARFKQFARGYFSSCQPLVAKIQADFYGMNDIVQIVEEYNRCVPH